MGVALLAAACSSSASPGVANLGSSPSATTASGGIAGNSGSSTLTAAQLQSLTKFAECVRKHGLPKFPDPPYSNGELNSMGFKKYSPQMEAATKACHADALAAGVVLTPAEIQKHLEQLLALDRCMRRHGVPTPDPSPQGVQASPIGLDWNSPQVQAAEKACDYLNP